MKLKVQEAIEILQALGQLDSYQNGADKPTLYKYGGDVRLRIAIARRKLKAVGEDYDEARNALLTEISGGSGELSAETFEGRKLIAEFATRNRELLKAEVVVDISVLPVASLKLEENPIPAAVLEMLGSFIDLEKSV